MKLIINPIIIILLFIGISLADNDEKIEKIKRLNDAYKSGLISKDILHHVKKGAFLINTSRGKILDEVAVVEALEDKTLSGVAVDVLSEEIHNNITESALWKCQEDHNVILTPHIAGATYDAMWTCEEYVQNLYIKKNLN